MLVPTTNKSMETAQSSILLDSHNCHILDNMIRKVVFLSRDFMSKMAVYEKSGMKYDMYSKNGTKAT